MLNQQTIDAILERARDDPAWWARKVLGHDLWDSQVQILKSIRDNPETAVASCHGIGKSFTAATATLWFLSVNKPSIVITTAPTDRQVKGILWKEIRLAHKNANLPLGGRLLQQELKYAENWWAWGFTAPEYDPDRFQGFHEVNILVIADEAAGISEQIYEGIDGILSSENSRLLMIGNPTYAGGRFGKAFKTAGISKFRIDAFRTPNFTEFGITQDDIIRDTWASKIDRPLPRPYLVTPHWVAKMAKRGMNSPFYQSRVMAQFPEQDTDTLIPISWIDRAVEADLSGGAEEPNILSADIARFGGNKTILLHRKGGVARIVKRIPYADTMQVVGEIRLMAREKQVDNIRVDADGIGAGVYDRLNELREPVSEMRSGFRPLEPDKFLNNRAEWWWHLRELFEKDQIDIENDDELISQLSNIKYKLNSRGQIVIESKEDMKKRGVESPDEADTLMLAFANSVREPIRIHVRSGGRRR